MNSQKDLKIQEQSLESASRKSIEIGSVLNSLTGKETVNYSEDQENMELHARATAQEKEIMYLREKIALASMTESQLLNEKYSLERKFSELRLALDEKQNEAITNASHELARRKGDLEVNLNLLSELKATEDERHVFTSAMLGILAEYGTWPHVTNASALSSSIKNLHDRLQFRIRTSHARLGELNSMIGNDNRNGFVGSEIPGLSPISGQLPSSSMGMHGSSNYNHYSDGKLLDRTDDVPRYGQEYDAKPIKSLERTVDTHQLSNNENPLEAFPGIYRNVAGHIVDDVLNKNEFPFGVERSTAGQIPHGPITRNEADSFVSDEEGPGIENFQINGDAKPGCKLLGCGFPVRGTSLCMFQWVRHYPDGTRQYIEGATNPDYVVTADDVDKLIAVECIPMDELGRQGELVRIFANDHNKITCDDEMQAEIDSYIAKGQAKFLVMILLDSSENWEPSTLYLRRSGFQVKVERTQAAVIVEKYSEEVLIKIPSGPSAQFVLKCANGSSYPFSTSNDIR
ncbi:hypothetical protein F511_09217 [Dorcoceras hygrometricum]|uniref:Uncharacterized protein n=1 Tax=Dorcoceras hygrometricum TaxID=472368 RepID=A0A2Z7CVD7_9LAMI|nr:hypothetical protein F511_09217 [Dorcoceras hygrometricum]